MRLNRRVPNGTHGGVRGRGLLSPSYSICAPGFQQNGCGREKRSGERLKVILLTALDFIDLFWYNHS